jgi:hypothetical protein
LFFELNKKKLPIPQQGPISQELTQMQFGSIVGGTITSSMHK